MANFKIDPSVLPKSLVNIEYDELVGKQTNGDLVPGTYYRITDFVTSVKGAWNIGFTSARHPFDIIVLALDNSTLSEDARAIQHDSDAYFANSNLNAWELKYRLSNTSKFSWASTDTVDRYRIDLSSFYEYTEHFDETIEFTPFATPDPVTIEGYVIVTSNTASYLIPKSSLDVLYGTLYKKMSDKWKGDTASCIYFQGKNRGVIYYMKDEFGNEAPYDFKNIQVYPTFIRDSFTSSSVADKLNYIELANITGNGFGTVVTENIILTVPASYYTFTNGNNEDASKSGLCHDNIIESYYDADDTYDLPNIVISSSTGQIHGNKFLQCSHKIYARGKLFVHNIFDECCNNVVIEGVINGEFHDNHITSALNVILVHGHMWDNRLFSLNHSILYSGSHVKNNHFLGLASGFKFLVGFVQNVHVFGYVNDVIVLPTLDLADSNRWGYLLSCVFHPYTSNTQIIGFAWLEKAIFQGPSNLHLQATDYTKNYGNIMVYPGDYTDVGMITEIPLNSDPLCEIKRNNSTTMIV